VPRTVYPATVVARAMPRLSDTHTGTVFRYRLIMEILSQRDSSVFKTEFQHLEISTGSYSNSMGS